ncbi:MAG: deoxyribonuclease IV, partial [Elusimicrobiota bacterium]|nr:deoxyribonuclease IV [Elusimicrobiota bacterium]
MLNIGCHLSTSKGFENMGKEALSLNANTFQYFSRNPRGSQVKDISLKDINALLKIMKDNNFAKLLAHAPYTLNPASIDSKIKDFTKMAMSEDLENMEYLPNNLYVFHPGNHVGIGIEIGKKMIIEILNDILKPNQTTIVLLETMAGKGTELCSTFEGIRDIIDKVKLSKKLGVCMDTCHIYSAGYDIVNGLDGVLEKFDKIIGLEKLQAIHLNDSMLPFSCHKDRHEKIGKGTIGLDAIIRFINHPKLKYLPFFLETPNELKGYKEEILILKKAY